MLVGLAVVLAAAMFVLYPDKLCLRGDVPAAYDAISWSGTPRAAWSALAD
jgi:hypothetical protein